MSYEPPQPKSRIEIMGASSEHDARAAAQREAVERNGTVIAEFEGERVAVPHLQMAREPHRLLGLAQHHLRAGHGETAAGERRVLPLIDLVGRARVAVESDATAHRDRLYRDVRCHRVLD